jgi:hypothetical protein
MNGYRVKLGRGGRRKRKSRAQRILREQKGLERAEFAKDISTAGALVAGVLFAMLGPPETGALGWLVRAFMGTLPPPRPLRVHTFRDRGDGECLLCEGPLEPEVRP